jgi:hypothetical protein
VTPLKVQTSLVQSHPHFPPIPPPLIALFKPI